MEHINNQHQQKETKKKKAQHKHNIKRNIKSIELEINNTRGILVELESTRVHKKLMLFFNYNVNKT